MSRLATQVERATAATMPVFKPLVRALAGAGNFTQIRRAVRKARMTVPPPTMWIETAQTVGRAEASIYTMLWGLSPAEKSEEMGLTIEVLLCRSTRTRRTLWPGPVAFLSVHAINRLAERAPRTTLEDVLELGWRFVRLNRVMMADETQYKGDPKGSGCLRIGQLYAYSNVMFTSNGDGTGAVWQDVRTVSPTSDIADVAYAKACERAILEGTPVPFRPRQDSYTLAMAHGKPLAN